MGSTSKDASAVTGGYGTDPDLMNPTTPWTRRLTQTQREAADALADAVFLPKEHNAPSQVGFADFLDEWVSAPYEKQQPDLAIVQQGLAMVDQECIQRFNRVFTALTPTERRTIVSWMSTDAGPGKNSVVRNFFKRFRYLVIGSYFTSNEGFHAIGYLGNQGLAAYPGPSPEALAIIESELRKLGL